MIKLGREVEYGARCWEATRTEITRIFVSSNKNGIRSIQFAYFENGTQVLSKQFGKSAGSNIFNIIDLNYPSEYLTRLTGHYKGTYQRCLTSLTFITNERTLGPFGEIKKGEDVERFDFQVGNRGEFGGFFGSCDGSGDLCSIGVYFKPNLTAPVVKEEKV